MNFSDSDNSFCLFDFVIINFEPSLEKWNICRKNGKNVTCGHKNVKNNT